MAMVTVMVMKKSKMKSKTLIAGKIPETVMLERQKQYVWCSCGRSKAQPFCDGEHRETTIKPLVFQSKFRQQANLCTCKLTANPPYCDGAHLAL
jgi:CDGSH-type Zn-finger protein